MVPTTGKCKSRKFGVSRLGWAIGGAYTEGAGIRDVDWTSGT